MHKLNIKLKKNKIKLITLIFIMILKRNFFIVNKCKTYIYLLQFFSSYHFN